MGKPSRDKGARVELKIRDMHRGIGVYAEKVSAMYRPGADLDIYARGADDAPLIGEAKARKTAAGSWSKVKGWLFPPDQPANDILFLVEDRQAPIVVLTWETYVGLLDLVGSTGLPVAGRNG